MKSGLLVCSFALNTARKTAAIQELNHEFVSVLDGVEKLPSMIQTISLFCQKYEAGKSFEKEEKYFQVVPKSYIVEDQDDYRIISFSIQSGSYNNIFQIQNIKSREVVFTPSPDDAPVHVFAVLVIVPKDTKDVVVRKGLLAFQSIGSYGIKTITAKALGEFYFETFNLTFRTGNIFAGDAIHRLFGKENLKKLTVVRNRVSADLSEQLELNACREEISFIDPIFKHANWFDLFSPNQDGAYEIGDCQFEDIRATVKIGNTTRTASLESFKNFSMTFDLPESIYQMDGTTVKPDALKAESIKICRDLAEGIDFSGGDHL